MSIRRVVLKKSLKNVHYGFLKNDPENVFIASLRIGLTILRHILSPDNLSFGIRPHCT